MITITLGWWLAPLIVTVLAIGYCIVRDLQTPRSYGGSFGLGGLGDAMLSAVRWVPAIIISLVAWLVWAIFT